jgi:hypothetical protein
VAELTAESIAEAATQPVSVSIDGQSAQAVPIPDQIQALQNQKTQEALAGNNASGGPKSGWNKLRIAKAVPPGAV